MLRRLALLSKVLELGVDITDQVRIVPGDGALHKIRGGALTRTQVKYVDIRNKTIYIL
jgi:hypothetical protein